MLSDRFQVCLTCSVLLNATLLRRDNAWGGGCNEYIKLENVRKSEHVYVEQWGSGRRGGVGRYPKGVTMRL